MALVTMVTDSQPLRLERHASLRTDFYFLSPSQPPPPTQDPPPQQTQLTLHFRVAIILINYTKILSRMHQNNFGRYCFLLKLGTFTRQLNSACTSVKKEED